MRVFDWLNVACLSGAACVTALANEHRGTAEHEATARPGPPVPYPNAAPSAEPAGARGPVWAARASAASPPRPAPASSSRAAPPPSIEPLTPTVPPPVDPTAWEPIPRSALVRRAPDRAPPTPASPAASQRTETFANTYYDFPIDHGGEADTPLYDASCGQIARVPRAFHDQICVQGSGRMASGETVSFAKRDCSCAARCPRTGQHICYEALDPARFPSGRGATGRAITPLSTVAVDPAVIPLGTRLYIPELAGLPRPDGTPHDGCFVAEDKGLRIRGMRVDVFMGEERTRRAWEATVPSNRGVHVLAGDARCAARR